MKGQFLPCFVEKALSELLYSEVRYQLKVDQLKRTLENCYDFTFKRAFSAIDDWNYGFVDASNIKRFLSKHGFSANRKDLIAILRRLDADGDCRVDFEEFKKGLRSSLTVYGDAAAGHKRNATTTMSLMLSGGNHTKQVSCERV
jgi:hypothetical protein